MLPFNIISRRSTSEIVLSSQKSVSKVANWIVVEYSQVSLLTLTYNWQTLSNSFLLEMVIAKDHHLSIGQ